MNYETERRIRLANEALALAAGVLTIMVLVRIVGGKDSIQRVRMRGHLLVAHAAERQADIFQTIAANQKTAYLRLTNVSV